MFFSLVCFAGSDFCGELITRTEECYRLCVSVSNGVWSRNLKRFGLETSWAVASQKIKKRFICYKTTILEFVSVCILETFIEQQKQPILKKWIYLLYSILNWINYQTTYYVERLRANSVFYLFQSKHIGLDQYLGLENTVSNPQMHINVWKYLIL